MPITTGHNTDIDNKIKDFLYKNITKEVQVRHLFESVTVTKTQRSAVSMSGIEYQVGVPSLLIIIDHRSK